MYNLILSNNQFIVIMYMYLNIYVLNWLAYGLVLIIVGLNLEAVHYFSNIIKVSSLISTNLWYHDLLATLPTTITQ